MTDAPVVGLLVVVCLLYEKQIECFVRWSSRGGTEDRRRRLDGRDGRAAPAHAQCRGRHAFTRAHGDAAAPPVGGERLAVGARLIKGTSQVSVTSWSSDQ